MTQTWNYEVSEVKVSVPKPQIMKKFIERIHKALHLQNIGIKWRWDQFEAGTERLC
jgi:hypothetical protein